ncbi:AVID protein, partial [Trogon melanurus]|nr:AVID protein [Trogon melanurus]
VPAPVSLPMPRLCHGVSSGSPLLQCVLTGDWINDLGSNMTIGEVDEKGVFSGFYNTSVKDTPNPIRISPPLGYKNLINKNGQPTFGFTINWNFRDFITVFVGQCFVDDTGEEFLRTKWLLRLHVNR